MGERVDWCFCLNTVYIFLSLQWQIYQWTTRKFWNPFGFISESCCFCVHCWAFHRSSPLPITLILVFKKNNIKTRQWCCWDAMNYLHWAFESEARKWQKCVFSSPQVFQPSWQIPVWGGTPLWELPSGWLLRYSDITAHKRSLIPLFFHYISLEQIPVGSSVHNHQRDNTIKYNV